jgi:hypothetical protein
VRKLKQKEIAEFRVAQLFLQKGCCALCKQPIIDDAVLDHCHKTGRIRAVLHRGCNSMLGKIENNMPRNKMNIDRLDQFANNLIKYLKDSYADVIHPTHKTAEEKKDAAKKTRARKKAKALSAKGYRSTTKTKKAANIQL